MTITVSASHPRFMIRVTTLGNLGAHYVFTNEESLGRWKRDVLPELEKQHGSLQIRIEDLPGLRVGDICHVWGEGMDTFKIEALIQYSEDRYGFVLDSGWTEEVAKCYI